MPDVVAPLPAPLSPLPYHQEVVSYLRTAEPELWQWASSAEVRSEQAQQTRTDLLKANYRLDAEGHPELSAQCARVAKRLNITVPITLYQANGSGGMNAMICHLPGQAHIIFSGPILATLQEFELEAVLAHELAHYALWDLEGGQFLVADRLLIAAANDPRAAASHLQTARRFRLYAEIFADRGAFLGSGNLEATISALVKTETGLSQVSASSYLRQAEEIFSQENPSTQGLDHPETFIRARALKLWSEHSPDLGAWLSHTIEGPLCLDALDLPAQQRLTALTRRFLAQLLRPQWIQSPAVLAHARSFFPDFSATSTPDESLAEELRESHLSTQEFFSYLLLDFATADPQLEQLPLAFTLTWSQVIGLDHLLEPMILKELNLGKRQLTKLKKDANSLLAKAEINL